MKSFRNLLSFLWGMLIIAVIVDTGVWLAAKGVKLIAKGFGRLVNRTKKV